MKFIPPGLCGCELEIDSEWHHEAVDGIMYGWPKEDTIKNIQILNICSIHSHFLTDPLPPDIYEYNGEMWVGTLKLITQQYVQHMIDIGRPLNVPLLDSTLATPEQKLYINLWIENGKGGVNKINEICECQIYSSGHRYTDFQIPLEHPIHSKHCKFHTNDIGHVQVLAEAKLMADTKSSIQLNHPELTQQYVMMGDTKVIVDINSQGTLDALGIDYSNPTVEFVPDFKISFDNNRQLNVTLPKGVNPITLPNVNTI